MPASDAWELLPFQFERLDLDRVLVTNMVGEHLFLTGEEFAQFMGRGLPADSPLVRRLRAKQVIRQADEQLPLDLLALKTRTRYSRLPYFTGLHIFVMSLRCEHSCPYCQVSRQSQDKRRFDMSAETAERALDAAFRSPSPFLKIEFQGGEPLLNFGLIREVVVEAERRNESESRDLSFVIATNLALLDDEVLEFCGEHDVYISTSLDGPADLHNRNRPRPGNDSWERAVAGIRRVRETLGVDRVSALMTTTERSLDRAKEIIDCYLEQGLREIFLRSLSPYGFAIKTKSYAAYGADRWLAFYEEGLDHILELNRRGTAFTEIYAAIILKKMLTNDDPGYVDLTSPVGYRDWRARLQLRRRRLRLGRGPHAGRDARHHLPARQPARADLGRADPLACSSRAARAVVHFERPDVQRLRVRTVLRFRPRLPPSDGRRLPRAQAPLGLLSTQHAHLQASA